MKKQDDLTPGTFEPLDLSSKRPRLRSEATETIDLSQIALETLSESGSYYVRGLTSSAIAKLFDALPIPVLLLDQSLSIILANQAWDKIVSDHHGMEGLPGYSIFPDQQFSEKIKSLMESVLATRKTKVAEGMIRIDKGSLLWGRLHFRSFRMEGDRFVLTIVEDLTAQKKQIVLQKKLHQALSKSRDELEELVQMRTSELSRSNEALKREIAGRKQAQGNLAKMVRRMETTLKGTVIALASMAEKRDPHTAGHQRRVSELAETIARKLELDQDRVRGVAISSALHDIGKIYVPAEFLSRPGTITRLERDIMREHPTVGHDILAEVDFPWPVAEIVLQHHEKLDGSGYPRSLRGDQIMLEARIVAVADVVEAMVSHRPYREAMSLEEAMLEIRSNAGVFYDEVVVQACVSLFAGGFQFT